MNLSVSDWVGSVGVAILLAAFLLNLFKKIPSSGRVYILMNIVGAGMACLASWLIHYIPFVILEATWMFVSMVALVNHFRKH